MSHLARELVRLEIEAMTLNALMHQQKWFPDEDENTALMRRAYQLGIQLEQFSPYIEQVVRLDGIEMKIVESIHTLIAVHPDLEFEFNEGVAFSEHDSGESKSQIDDEITPLRLEMQICAVAAQHQMSDYKLSKFTGVPESELTAWPVSFQVYALLFYTRLAKINELSDEMIEYRTSGMHRDTAQRLAELISGDAPTKGDSLNLEYLMTYNALEWTVADFFAFTQYQPPAVKSVAEAEAYFAELHAGKVLESKNIDTKEHAPESLC